MQPSSPNKSHTLPRLALLSICIVAILVSFFPYSFGAYDTFASEILNISHLPAFFLFTLALFHSLPKHYKKIRYPFVFITSLILAITIEWIQSFIGRDASLKDIVLDLIGITTALGGIFLWQKADRPIIRSCYTLFVTAILIFFCYPLAIQGYSIYWQQQQFPMLGDFENKMELYLWKPQGKDSNNPTNIELVTSNATHGNQALRVITGGDWGGINLLSYDLDWSNYKYFALDIFNPTSEAFRFFIRIDDSDKRALESYKHRFNHLQMINPGMNRIKIPIHTIVIRPQSRNLNIKSIRRVILHMEENAPSRIFYIDNIRLK